MSSTLNIVLCPECCSFSEQNTYHRRYYSMAWESKTRQFDQEELAVLEQMTAEEMAASLLNSMEVVALRALAEVMLNGATAKLDVLLMNMDLNRHWSKFLESPFVDSRDNGYAHQLFQRLKQNTEVA